MYANQIVLTRTYISDSYYNSKIHQASANMWYQHFILHTAHGRMQTCVC